MRLRTLALACCASAAFWTPAQAGVIVGDYTLEEGSFGAQTGVHSDATQQGTSLDAYVNQDGSAVTFSSDQILTITGSGEATVYPLEGLLTNLMVDFEKAWSSITFSFSGDVGTFSLLVNGVANFASPGNCDICTIGNGQNKFTLSGNGITSLDFEFAPGIDSARQFRVEGVSNVPAVPEPGTWAMLLIGFGAVGFGMRRRRQKATVSYA